MTAVSKNLYFDVLDDIVDTYNTYHRTIKIKPRDVKSDCYAEYNLDFVKNLKFKVGDHVRISKYKTFLLNDMPLRSYCHQQNKKHSSMDLCY